MVFEHAVSCRDKIFVGVQEENSACGGILPRLGVRGVRNSIRLFGAVCLFFSPLFFTGCVFNQTSHGSPLTTMAGVVGGPVKPPSGTYFLQGDGSGRITRFDGHGTPWPLPGGSFKYPSGMTATVSGLFVTHAGYLYWVNPHNGQYVQFCPELSSARYGIALACCMRCARWIMSRRWRRSWRSAGTAAVRATNRRPSCLSARAKQRSRSSNTTTPGQTSLKRKKPPRCPRCRGHTFPRGAGELSKDARGELI